MKLAYRGFDRTGREVRSTIEAPDPADAIEKLRQKSFFVQEIHPERGGGAEKGGAGRRLGRGKKLKTLAMFTRELYVLLASGTALVDALGALERQARDQTWKEIVTDIQTKISEGSGFSEALESYPLYFDSAYRSLVAAGESSGQLPGMLDRLASLVRKRLRVRNAIVGSMIYPIMLLGISVVVLSVLLTYVVPRFAELFETLDSPIPATTRGLIAAGEFLQSYWWVVLGALVGGIGGLKLYLTTPDGKRALDTFVLRVPQLNTIIKGFATAGIVRLLGILLEGNVSVLEALRLTRESAKNVHYAELVGRAEEAVTRGDPISSAFADTNLISPSIYEAARNGEQTGRLGSLLLNIADFQDEDNEVIIKSLTSIIEPVILVLLGLLVGLVAVSMFTPLFDLTAMSQGGAT